MPLAALLSVLPGLQTPAPEPAAPRARGWDDFPVFVWRETYAGKPLPTELAEPFGGVILMRNEDSDWARERGLAYLVWNVAGRDALHLDADEAWNARVEQWIETQDERLLVREPCLNDPQTIAELFSTLDATIATHGRDRALGFVLGDEVSLTPNGAPFDLCRCPHCESRWRAYARERGLPERAPLTDEVRIAMLDGDDSKLGPWLARRRFERENMLALLQDLARRADAFRGPVGVLGIGDETPFGGLDVQACLRFLRLSECYPVAEAREIEWTARLDVPEYEPWPPPSLATVFLQDETPDGAAWVAWDHWMRGGTGLVVWSDEHLGKKPDHTRRLAGAVATIRNQRFDRSWPRQFPLGEVGGVALVRDADSVAYAWMRDALLDGPTWPRRLPSHQAEHGSRERGVQAWRKAIQDAGLRPGALSLQSVGESQVRHTSTTFPVLVLVELAVLGDDDRRRLERHLDAGRVLVVHGELGTFDRAGNRRATSVLEELRARAPARVLDGSAPSRALVARALEHAGMSGGPPLELGPAMRDVDWLVTASPKRTMASRFLREPLTTWNVALLPNLPTADQRARLRPIPLEIEPPSGWSLRWVHPPPEAQRVLPAGDAAVFVLTLIDAPDPTPEEGTGPR